MRLDLLEDRRLLSVVTQSGDSAHPVYSQVAFQDFVNVAVQATHLFNNNSDQDNNNAALNSLMTRAMDPSEQGRLQGAIAALQGMAHMIGPTLFTTVFAMAIDRAPSEQFPGAPFLLAAAILAISMVVAWQVVRRAGHETTRSQSVDATLGH